MRPLTFLSTALVLLGVVGGVAFAPAALAEPEGGGDDISAKIKEQMQKIIDLMRQNEEALLEISTGGRARPTRPDVTPPALPETEGRGQGTEGSEGAEGDAGRASAEELEKLLREQQKASEAIPNELEELVRMVPF